MLSGTEIPVPLGASTGPTWPSDLHPVNGTEPTGSWGLAATALSCAKTERSVQSAKIIPAMLQTRARSEPDSTAEAYYSSFDLIASASKVENVLASPEGRQMFPLGATSPGGMRIIRPEKMRLQGVLTAEPSLIQRP
jgi:hypothetical protein